MSQRAHQEEQESQSQKFEYIYLYLLDIKIPRNSFCKEAEDSSRGTREPESEIRNNSVVNGDFP